MLIDYNGKKLPIDEFFNLFLGANHSKNSIYKSLNSPATDVKISEDGVSFEVELPGVDAESITVSLENNDLRISARKLAPPHKTDDRFLRTERQYGEFVRVFTLGDIYDGDSINPVYSNGVLYVNIKRKPESKPRTFKVINESKQINA